MCAYILDQKGLVHHSLVPQVVRYLGKESFLWDIASSQSTQSVLKRRELHRCSSAPEKIALSLPPLEQEVTVVDISIDKNCHVK